MNAAALLLLLPLGTSQAGPGYRGLAKEFSKAAARAEVRRIAVVPFTAVDGSPSLEGEGVAERFTTQLVRAGGPEVVERRLLEKVMEEHRFMGSGAVKRDDIKRLGEILAADAILTGRILESRGRIEVHARLIHVETGRALHAATMDVEPDWVLTASIPRLEVPAPAFEVPAPLLLRDAVTGSGAWEDCSEAEASLEVLARTTLGLKARYWAARLRQPGFSLSALTRNPGSDLPDADLRERFYGLLKSWQRQDAVAPLSPAELRILEDAESKSEDIRRSCERTDEGREP